MPSVPKPRPRSILFLAPHRPGRAPSQRYRFEHYLGWLQQHGYTYTYAPLLDEADDRGFYQPGNYLGKAWILVKTFFRRLRQVLGAGRYGIVFVHREAFMTGTTIFERLARRSGAPMVFEFDDSIWLPNVSEQNKRLAFLKRPEKTHEIVRMASMVWAGNSYLARYARQHNPHVVVVPSVIDTDLYTPVPFPGKDPARVCIGWTGSPTTIPHFELVVPALQRIKEKYGNRVYFKVIGDPNYRNDELGITGVAWSAATEVVETCELDLGLMPLPDDIWTRGKCGMKALIYMGLGIPAIVSPVAVNAEIVEDGVSGLHATTMDDYVAAISRLVDDAPLRRQMGQAARQRIVDHYSVLSERPKILAYLDGLLAQS